MSHTCTVSFSVAKNNFLIKVLPLIFKYLQELRYRKDIESLEKKSKGTQFKYVQEKCRASSFHDV